jgi:hypothetical protein
MIVVIEEQADEGILPWRTGGAGGISVVRKVI